MERLRKKPSKLLLVSSSGGHLKHLTATFDAWQNYERVWVSFKQPDVESALAEEKVYWAYYPTTRNVKNAIRNLFLAFKIFPRERPDVVVSAGAGVAVYQRYIQSLPPGTAPECGAPWTFRLRDWPLFEWYEPVIRGFGDCAVPDYLLGVPLPIWSMLYFCFVLLLVWFGWFKARAVG